MSNVSDNIGFLKSAGRFPKVEVIPATVANAQLTNEEWNRTVYVLDAINKEVEHASDNVKDLKDKLDPALIVTLGQEESDVAKCEAANSMIKALYLDYVVPRNHKVVLSSLFVLNGSKYYITLTDYDNGDEYNIVYQQLIEADKLCELKDGDDTIGYVWLDSANYSLIQNQGEGLNRMPYLSAACFDTEKQPKITNIIVDNRLKKLESGKGKRICVWGDSITWGAGASANDKPFATLLQRYVKSNVSYTGEIKTTNHEVWNCGVGGDNMGSILVRCGGAELYLTKDIVLPGDGSPVTVDAYLNWQWVEKCVKSSANPAEHVNLMVQGEYGRGDWGTGEWGDARRTVNPVVVNGIPCVWEWEQGATMANGRYTIRRTRTTTRDIIIKAGTPLYTQGSRIHADVMIFCGGTNGGFGGDPAEYVKMVESAIEASGAKEYIVCTPYGGVCWTEVGGLAGMEALEAACIKRFGPRYFNWRKFMHNDAFVLTNRGKTEEDIAAIEAGHCPPSMLDDDVHPNDYGHEAIAKQLYNMLDSLGYI